MRYPNQAWDPAHAVLEWPDCRNVRDVGSMPLRDGGFVRRGVLIRSDNLERLGVDGVAAVRELAPRLIIDLRTEGFDIPQGPHPFEADPVYRRLAYIDLERDAERDPEREATVVATYRGSVDRNGHMIAAIVLAIGGADETGETGRPVGIGRAGEGPVVVHCHSGKDRTGVIVALLLDLVGAERSAIAADYAYSALAQQRSDGSEAPSVVPETILATLQHVDTRYGGVRRYLHDHGVSAEVVETIRRRWTGSAGLLDSDSDGL